MGKHFESLPRGALDEASFERLAGPGGRQSPGEYAPIVAILPRFVRFRDAPAFFAMDKNRFNREVRPHLTEIRIGTQGRAFDRLEMEAAAFALALAKPRTPGSTSQAVLRLVSRSKLGIRRP